MWLTIDPGEIGRKRQGWSKAKEVGALCRTHLQFVAPITQAASGIPAWLGQE